MSSISSAHSFDGSSRRLLGARALVTGATDLKPRAAFALLTSILVTLLASSSAPTPLYAIYQARWRFSPVAVTVVFGVYAVAVLVSLLVLGALSDHIGRRPVLTAALVAQAGVTFLFATASGLDVLLLARVLQGLATGAAVRGALAVAAPSLVAVWALAGFYASLGPSLAALVDGSNSTILGGAGLFVLAGSGALTVLAFHRTDARTFALAGAGLIIVGVALLLAAVPARSPILFFTGTAIAGAGFGGGFQGGLRTIVPLARADERAGVIAVVYVICYLALGLPAIGAGVLVVHTTVTHTAVLFGLGVIALAASTAAGILVNGRRARANKTSAATTGCLATR